MNDLALFVYGTLQHGEAQAGLLASLGRRAARVRGRLFHLPAGYPALQLGGSDLVHGEIVDAPDGRLLTLLDTFEGVSDGLFRRVEVSVLLGLTTERAWAYVMDNPARRGGRRLPKGRWRSPGRVR